MEPRRFDLLAAALGRALDRRSSLRAIAGFMAAGLATTVLDAPAPAEAKHGGNDRRRRNQRGAGRPGAEGPCGNGSRRENACTKDKDCCTGICNTAAGKKNKDGKGRCRCLNRGKACSADRNCCNTLTCVKGTCSGASKNKRIPTGDSCTPSDECADAEATCTTYESGTPAGTYCLFARNGSCSSDPQCATSLCDGGICLSCSCGACNVSCGTPDVCPTCAHTTIQGAIDAATPGDTILIAAGTYSENLTIGSSLNLKGCGAVTVKNAAYDARTITIADGATVEIVDLTVDAYSTVSDSGGGINSQGKLYLCHNTIVQNSIWLSAVRGAGVRCQPGIGQNPELHVLDQTIIRNNSTDSYGGGIAVDSYCASVITNGAQIIDNQAKKGGGITYMGTALPQVITNSALVDGNTVTEQGGGIFIVATGLSPSSFDLQISGNAKISNNTSAQYGGGIGSQAGNASNPEYITISGDAEISDNTSTDSYGGGGGGIYATGLHVRISGDAKISSNNGPTGGGIYIENLGGPYASGVYGLDVSGNVTIENNTAVTRAGGILSGNVPTRLSENVIVRDNSAGLCGGISIQLQPIELADNVKITGNSATDESVLNSGDGGGLCLKDTGSASQITGSVVISGNTAANRAGGVYLDDGGVFPSPVVLGADTSVTGNTANGGPGSGGGLFANGNQITTTVTGGSVITGNTPDNCAGVTC
jgi:hypothetical protein